MIGSERQKMEYYETTTLPGVHKLSLMKLEPSPDLKEVQKQDLKKKQKFETKINEKEKKGDKAQKSL